MNVEGLFKAVKAEPDQHTLVVVALELERQGYRVYVNDKYEGSASLIAAEEQGALSGVPSSNGYKIQIVRDSDCQSFRVHLLDVDEICISSVETSPVVYNPEFTTRFFESGGTN